MDWEIDPASPNYSSSFEGVGPAAVGFDNVVNFGHEAEGFVESGDDLLTLGNAVFGELRHLVALDLLLADLIAADMKLPDAIGHEVDHGALMRNHSMTCQAEVFFQRRSTSVCPST